VEISIGVKPLSEHSSLGKRTHFLVVLCYRTEQRATQRWGSDVHLELIGALEAAGILVDTMDDLDEERRFQVLEVSPDRRLGYGDTGPMISRA